MCSHSEAKMGISWGEEFSILAFCVSTLNCFLCPMPWPLALSSECPSLLFPSILGLYSCKHSLILVLFNWQIGAHPKGQLVKVSLPGMIPGWLLALGAGPLRGTVEEWRVEQWEPGACGSPGTEPETWLITCGGRGMSGQNIRGQMHTRATWVSFCLGVCCMELQAAVLVSGL